MLADITSPETVMALATVGMFIVALIALFRKQEITQPLNVEIVKALHDQFASKSDFETFVEKTDIELHEQREILRKEIPEMVERVSSAGEKRVRRIHARLDPLMIGVAQLCAKQGLKMPQPQDPTDD